MKERLIEFLRAENKSSAQLAEEIGVQASGISHILSGRNNPSLDFILKMLEKYQFLSTDWLLFGKGSMYKENQNQSLFNEDQFAAKTGIEMGSSTIQNEKNTAADLKYSKTEPSEILNLAESENKSDIIRIVWFYGDNSFKEYFPRG
jgi:transcriptional regulator with XRE-family HTH domain